MNPDEEPKGKGMKTNTPPKKMKTETKDRETETPRTDAATFNGRDMGQDSGPPHFECVDADVCRQLERELGDALDTLKLVLTGADDVLENFSKDGIVDDLSQAMDGLRQDVEQARAVLARGMKG